MGALPTYRKVAADQLSAPSFVKLCSKELQEVAAISAWACNEQNQQQTANLAAACTNLQ